MILRSKRPELVEQEFYALFLAHAAIHKFMTRAATATGQAAEDFSFIHVRYVCSDGVFPLPPLFSPEQPPSWLDSVLKEIAAGCTVTRRGKRNPCGVKRKMSNFPLRKRGDPLNQPCNPSLRMLFI